MRLVPGQGDAVGGGEHLDLGDGLTVDVIAYRPV